MESIGEKLKAAREQRGVTHEQVARETNIAKRYLQALEDEDFSAFPGDTYLLGFMRTYADYLGLRGDELAAIYRNMRIQEQPVPVNELIVRKPVLSPAAIAGIALGGLALVAVVVLVLRLTMGRPGGDTAEGPREKAQYSLGAEPLEKRLYPGDTILCELDGQKYVLELSAIEDAVFIKAPSGRLRFALGEEFGIDLDSDNSSDLRGSVLDFVKSDPGKGAMLKLAYAGISLAAAPAASPVAVSLPETGPAAASSVSPTATQSQAKGQVLIEARNSPYPFTLNVTFRQYCLFRYEADRKGERVERYYRKTEQISANANNGIKLWASNASACVAQVVAGGKTVDVELGRPGEVVVKDIKWVQTESGGWALTSIPVD
jgi:cytoskeletal protein RodZ